MRQSAGTMMTCVTWRHAPRAAAWTLRKNSNTAAAQMGGGREPKLSGQKRLGLTWVPWGSTGPEGAKVRPQGAFLHLSLLPSSSDTLGPRVTEFCVGVHWYSAIRGIVTLTRGQILTLNFQGQHVYVSMCLDETDTMVPKSSLYNWKQRREGEKLIC